MISARLKADQAERQRDRHAPRDQVGDAVLEEVALAEIADHGAADPAEELDVERTVEAVGLADDFDVGLRRRGPAIEIARSPDSRVSMKASVITVSATRRPRARRRAIRFSIGQNSIQAPRGFPAAYPEAAITVSPPAAPCKSRACAMQEPGPTQAMGGRFEAHGRAASNAADICNTPRSSQRRPTICKPTGRPAAVNPQGIDAAGFCDRLNG